jgi:predicted AAA+ superfamily ATPase
MVARYYQILEDTLLGNFLLPYDKSIRKQQGKSPKFYFFDLGVLRALSNSLQSPLTKGSYGYGVAFEHFFILEVIRLNSYLRKRFKLSYLITKDGAEIDLIIERQKDDIILIEIKSNTQPSIIDGKHLKNLGPFFKNADSWIVSQIETPREEQGIRFLPWEKALKEIFSL